MSNPPPQAGDVIKAVDDTPCINTEGLTNSQIRNISQLAPQECVCVLVCVCVCVCVYVCVCVCVFVCSERSAFCPIATNNEKGRRWPDVAGAVKKQFVKTERKKKEGDDQGEAGAV